jgi:hypothetical protein
MVSFRPKVIVDSTGGAVICGMGEALGFVLTMGIGVLSVLGGIKGYFN